MNYSQNKKRNTSTEVDQNGSSEQHTALIIETLLALSSELPEAGRFFRNETGVALNMRTEEPFTYGVKGSPDIYGLIIGGYYIGLECKTGSAVLNDNQKKFKRMCDRFSTRYFVVHSPGEAVAIVRHEVERIKKVISLLEQHGLNYEPTNS